MASVEKRMRDGKMSYRVHYRDPRGKSRNRSFTKKVDATGFAASVETDKARGEWVDPKSGRITFGEWATQWLATKRDLKPATLDDYSRLLGCHVLPFFGEMWLSRIQRVHVEEWLAGLAAKGLGTSRTRKSFVVLASVLDAAVEHDHIARNPARSKGRGGRSGRVALPRATKPRRRYLTADEVARLAGAAGDWSTAVEVVAYSGMRFSEFVALRREDCDLLRRRLTLDENATEIDGKLVWQAATKTDEIVRPRLPAFVCEHLARHLETVPDTPRALVFTGADGGPIRYRNWLRYVWRPAVRQAGLEGLTPHELRHTAASLLIAGGADPKTVQEQLGHRSIKTTYDVYGHLWEGHADDVFERLDEAGRVAARRPSVAQSGGQVVPLRSE